MSDLKKTLQAMDKTEVGEYRHGRGHFPTEDDGGRANVEVLQALCPNPGATALESVVWAADQIEALEIFRRDAKVENAELHSQIESLTSENTRLRALLEEIEREIEDYRFKIGRVGLMGHYDEEDMHYAGPALLKTIQDRLLAIKEKIE